MQTTDGENERNVGARERFKNTLRERAAGISCVRNDIYTTKAWHLVVYFVLGVGALVLLVLSMVFPDGTTECTACLIVGVLAAVAVFAFRFILRALVPTSFLQYTAVVADKTYVFRVMSKTRSLFSDGTNVVDVDRNEIATPPALELGWFRYDFFALMEPDERICVGNKETYKGSAFVGKRKVKCKITFVDNVPTLGIVDGARIKYFDVNNTKEKFVVPVALKSAARSKGISLPKLAGIYYREGEKRDVTNQ